MHNFCALLSILHCRSLLTTGVRASTLLMATVNFIGAGLQAIPLSNLQTQTWLIHLGAIFNSVGGPVEMALGPLISATWFPPHQRTTSTALASLSAYVGMGLSFIIGPLLVPDVGNHSSTIGESIDYIKIRNNMSHSQLMYLKEKIMHLMYIELGAAALILLVVIVYFPSKPKLPPSVTATVDRLDFKYGFKRLICNKQMWLLLFINGVIVGVYTCLVSILDLNLSQFGIGEKTAGWLGFGASMAGIVAGISLSVLADRISRHMKVIQFVLLVGATVCFALFAFMCARIIPYSKAVLFLTFILGGFFTNGTLPLFFEMAVETAYPVAEGITSVFLMMSCNFLLLVFYIFSLLPKFGLKWINWCTFATFAACVPLLALWRERYYRSEVDDQGETDHVTSNSISQ
ncbi:solute carrier family 49 member 4 homolog isoform X2 [Oculina patagonica]